MNLSASASGPAQKSVKNIAIQNYRAVAIILVLTFHAGFPLTFGYLGVDIFFVISGYVITLRTLKEIRETNNFNINNFLRRRARRLFPSIAFLLSVITLISIFFQTPLGKQQVTAKTGLGGLIMAANIVISEISHGYFGVSAKQNALTHLWSIAVEVQFYVFFALALVVLIKHLRLKSCYLILLILTTAISFVLYVSVGSDIAFYNTFLRAWEFSIGILLAIFVSKPRDILSKPTGSVLFVFSVLCLFASQSELFHLSILQRLFLALVTISILLVISNNPLPLFISRILSNRVGLWIGDISYSIYLWHWPLIVIFSPFLFHNDFGKLLLIAIVLLISALANMKVERTYIRENSASRKLILASVAIPLALLLGLGLGSKMQWGISWYGLPESGGNFSQTCIPVDNFEEACRIDYPGSNSNIVVVGDSQARANASGLVKFAASKRMNLVVISRPGNPFVDARCHSIHVCNDPIMTRVHNFSPQILVLTNLWSLENVSQSDVRSMNEKLLEPLTEWASTSTHLLLLVKPITPISNFDKYFTIYNRFAFNDWVFKAQHDSSQKQVNMILEKFVKENKGVAIVDPMKTLCANENCNLLSKGIAKYADSTHLSEFGAEIAFSTVS